MWSPIGGAPTTPGPGPYWTPCAYMTRPPRQFAGTSMRYSAPPRTPRRLTDGRSDSARGASDHGPRGPTRVRPRTKRARSARRDGGRRKARGDAEGPQHLPEGLASDLVV